MLPVIRTPLPGPKSRALAARLRTVEGANVTFLPVDESFPIFWQRGDGCLITDEDGNKLLDMTAAFGVSALGHGPTAATIALTEQCESLLHGMGDVHPTRAKLELCEALCDLSALQGAKVLLGTSGGDAVEAAIKSAVLRTGKRRVVAFDGGYHGLNLGALNATARTDFRYPFQRHLADFVTHLPYGEPIHALPDDTAAVLVEVIQGRGGVREASTDWLLHLRALCNDHGALLIVDEVFTGFWRTGEVFAHRHHGVIPDIIACGKILGGGMPISACIGSGDAMSGWPVSTGESIHTSTFLGHPGGCAAALATLAALSQMDAGSVVNRLGAYLSVGLETLAKRHPDQIVTIRGKGLMFGIQMNAPGAAVSVSDALLQRGVITLPAGNGDVLELTPPFVVTPQQLDFVIDALDHSLTP
ncbi:MAG: aspartate aminotransferase family protein [Armatimonadota bacterium]